MNDLVRNARIAALIGHHGQYRRDGKTPYMNHVEGTALAVAQAGHGDVAVAVAYLHDFIEETGYSVGLLRSVGIPEVVIEKVLLLTKRKGQDYEAYIFAISQDFIARAVKIADIQNNLSDDPTDKQKEKYRKALEILKA